MAAKFCLGDINAQPILVWDLIWLPIWVRRSHFR